MHSEEACLQMHTLLQKLGLNLQALTHLALNIGPGSFTGLRVSFNIVRTLAYSLNLPIYSINRFHLLRARHCQEGEATVLAIQALRNAYYVAAYRREKQDFAELLSPISLSTDEFNKQKARFQKILVDGETPNFSPDTNAQDLVQLVQSGSISDSLLDWKSIRPLYIRASQAEEKLRQI